MAKLPLTITAEVLAHARGVKRGPGNWFDRLPADVQAEMVALKASVDAGDHPDMTRSAIAAGLEVTLRQRGLLTVKRQEISRWLAR